MANPLIDTEDWVFGQATDSYGDDYYNDRCHVHVAGILLLAGAVLVTLQVLGFRAMVGVGRG